jgi:lipopolysaccharide/colanic/teichoic acid biosynthesis glycosyltransferase
MLNRFLALLVLLVASPILIIFAILIKLESAGPIFFLQTRVGQNFKPFKIYKFRSMYFKQPSGNLTIGDDKRITKVGRLIRKFHLDEFAQLINVVRGEMNFIGARPEVEEFMAYYKDDWQKVLKLKPGITGLASVKYAKKEYLLLATSQDPRATYISRVLRDKLRLEKFYIDRGGILLNISILWWTVKALLGFKL